MKVKCSTCVHCWKEGCRDWSERKELDTFRHFVLQTVTSEAFKIIVMFTDLLDLFVLTYIFYIFRIFLLHFR